MKTFSGMITFILFVIRKSKDEFSFSLFTIFTRKGARSLIALRKREGFLAFHFLWNWNRVWHKEGYLPEEFAERL